MRPYRRQLLVLLPLMGVVALVAQVAGVGTTERTAPRTPKAVALTTIHQGTVPDVGSTVLARHSVRAASGEAVRMAATMRVRASKLPRGEVAQVVCGIRYSRAGDASWTLGTPYETVVLPKAGASSTVKLERSFVAPAGDEYRMSAACHVSSPKAGATVTATGTMQARLGLPTGAATPVE
jgi:hypothetical protein